LGGIGARQGIDFLLQHSGLIPRPTGNKPLFWHIEL
jgi:hypothetical protein